MSILAARWAATAIIALPLLVVGLPVQPTLAEESDPPVDFVCFDSLIDGKIVIVCEPASVVADECEENDLEGPECDAAESREVPTQSLTTGHTDSGHGGGSLVRGARTSALRN